jgi:hypothetical protein
MLTTIVIFVAIGQPWVAGMVATAGLAVIVAVFVTAQYQPAAFHTPEAPPGPARSAISTTVARRATASPGPSKW